MAPARPLIAAAAVAFVLAAAVGGCGGSSGSGHVHFAKTKFVLHAGLAFGAFHRYIYKPYRAHQLTPPLRHKAAVAKAALAAAFAYHETKLALTDARSSAILSKLLAPVLALQNRLRGLGAGLKGGRVDPAAVQSTNGAVDGLRADSAGVGATIKDRSAPLPSAG